ncbi:hypothetical protein BDV93DRAFT_553407 [Ceratobasidium sp. AG-I]|nr:hypothetical protein BDV93DRAFT_553407 [Ceratobasidium sp. AG-I]
MAKRPTVLVPASSPTPVRESQPKPPDPDDPSHGPIRGRAAFDTPPADSQPVELTREQRSRVPSARKREQLLSQGKLPSSAPTSNAAATTKTSRASQPRKTKKRAIVLSASDDNDEPPRARQARNQGTKGSASKSKSTARSSAVAPPSGTSAPPAPTSGASAPVALHPDTAASLGKLFGVDLVNTSSQEFERAVRSLSDNKTMEMGSSKRYAKVRGTSPSPLSTLNKQGGYHRDRLEEQQSSSGKTARRSQPMQDTRMTKRPRKNPNDEPDELDEIEADPDADMSDPEGCPPLPPPLFRTQLSKQASASSTQGAVVNATISRPSGAQSTPALHTRRPAHPMYEALASDRGLAITPVPEPRKTRPSAGTRAAPSNPQQHVRAPKVTTHKAPPYLPLEPPNPSTATQSETEPEPPAPPAKALPHPNTRLAQPSKPTAAKTKPHHTSSQPGNRRNNPVPPAEEHDELMDRLKHILAGGDENDVLDWATHFVQKRTHNPEPGPSKPRTLRDAGADLRSRFRANARSRTPDDVRRHARYPRLRDPSPTPMPASDSDNIPEPEELVAAVAAVAGGAKAPVVQDAEGTGLGKYPGYRLKVATKAIVELLATASEKGVYQNQEIYMKWALNCYRRAWRDHAAHVPYMEAPDDLLKTIALRVSWLRTKVKERIRVIVRFKLGFRDPGGSDAIVAANRELFGKIFPNTFHCRNHAFDEDQYEHPAFLTAICEAFFWDSESFAIQYYDRFERMPLPAVAFVLTMMQEAIEEWQTGRYHPRDLSSAKQRPIFDSHLRGLYIYMNAARDRMFKFRGAWFRRGMEHAGVTVYDRDDNTGGRYCQPVTRAENVRPDTPPQDHVPDAFEPEAEEPVPEIEAEEDDEDVDVRFTAESKGKSKPSNEEMIWD